MLICLWFSARQNSAAPTRRRPLAMAPAAAACMVGLLYKLWHVTLLHARLEGAPANVHGGEVPLL
jgi:hypothetical protein